MSLSQGETSLGDVDDPFASSGEGGEEVAEETADQWFGLRNAHPAIEPAQVGRELDLQAEWWQHAGAGFIKQTNSAGTEAWMHYVMAVILLLMAITDTEAPDESSGTEGAVDDEEGGEMVFSGPQ